MIEIIGAAAEYPEKLIIPALQRTEIGQLTKMPFSDQRRAISHLQSRSRKSEQDDKWNFCLTTAIIAVNRRNHEQTTPPEPLTGLQGEGGAGRRQGRPHNRPAGGAFRRSPQSDHGMEIAA